MNGNPRVDAVAPREVTDRAFGCDVDGIGRGALDAARNLARRGQRQAQAAIGGTGIEGKPSGVRKSTATPCLRRLWASDISVRTTPLTCGCQASVAMSRRIRRSGGCVVSHRLLASQRQSAGGNAACGWPAAATCGGGGHRLHLSEHTESLFQWCDRGRRSRGRVAAAVASCVMELACACQAPVMHSTYLHGDLQRLHPAARSAHGGLLVAISHTVPP